MRFGSEFTLTSMPGCNDRGQLTSATAVRTLVDTTGPAQPGYVGTVTYSMVPATATSCIFDEISAEEARLTAGADTSTGYPSFQALYRYLATVLL